MGATQCHTATRFLVRDPAWSGDFSAWNLHVLPLSAWVYTVFSVFLPLVNWDFAWVWDVWVPETVYSIFISLCIFFDLFHMWLLTNCHTRITGLRSLLEPTTSRWRWCTAVPKIFVSKIYGSMMGIVEREDLSNMCSGDKHQFIILLPDFLLIMYICALQKYLDRRHATYTRQYLPNGEDYANSDFKCF